MGHELTVRKRGDKMKSDKMLEDVCVKMMLFNIM